MKPEIASPLSREPSTGPKQLHPSATLSTFGNLGTLQTGRYTRTTENKPTRPSSNLKSASLPWRSRGVLKER
jgi:hypothetical protein